MEDSEKRWGMGKCPSINKEEETTQEIRDLDADLQQNSGM